MFLIFFTIILAFLQPTLVSRSFGSFSGINLVLVFIVSLSMLRGGKESLGLAFVGGFFLSLFSDIHFGFLPLFFVVVAFASSLSGGDMFKSNMLISGLFGLLWCLLFELLVMLSYIFSDYPLNIPQYCLKIVLSRSFLNAGLIVVVYPLLAKIESLLFRENHIGLSS